MFLGACSTTGSIPPTPSREIASNPPTPVLSECAQLAQNLLTPKASLEKPVLSAEAVANSLRDLRSSPELRQVQESKALREVAELSLSSENRENSYLALAMLKRMNPDSSDEVVRNEYLRLLRTCGL